MPFSHIEAAIDAVRRGEIVVVVDDEDRENEGDLIMAAERITPETMGFMVRHTSGVICMPMMGDRLDALNIPLMVVDNTEAQRTAFTVSVDAAEGVSTGISAADRAQTVKTLINPLARPNDLVRPGHIFPLRYREGGVLKRAGHTEAGVDLARLAGLEPAGVLAEVSLLVLLATVGRRSTRFVEAMLPLEAAPEVEERLPGGSAESSEGR